MIDLDAEFERACGRPRQRELERLTASEENFFDALDRRFYDYPDDIAAFLIAFLEQDADSPKEAWQ